VQAQQQHSRATARPDPQAEQGVAEPAGCVPRPRPPGGHEEADPLPAGGPPGQRGQLLGVHHRQCLEEVPAQDTQWNIRAQRRDGAVRHQRSAKRIRANGAAAQVSGKKVGQPERWGSQK